MIEMAQGILEILQHDMMTHEQAATLKQGDRVIVLVPGTGEGDEGEITVPAGDTWCVDFVNNFPAPQGLAITVSHPSGVVNVFDEADFGGRYPLQLVDQEDKPAFYTVSIFLVDRAYGGPEEGGWWYNHGHPAQEIPEGVNHQDMITVFTADKEEEAQQWAETLQLILDAHPNTKRRSDIYSVLSEGRFQAVVQGGWPRAWPETKPHYE